MQIPVFLILFLAPVYVPLELLKGWIHSLASINPATALVEAGRGFISGEPTVVGLAYLAGVALVALMLVWALTGLRRAERGA
jgi:ABC-2 type transport system permease protein